jgi:hypothetical protein
MTQENWYGKYEENEHLRNLLTSPHQKKDLPALTEGLRKEFCQPTTAEIGARTA